MAGGYLSNGDAYITSGHHRIIASAIRGMQTGDYSILEQLISNGNFNSVQSINSVSQSYNFTSFPKQWQ
ncbi:hypothetical protein [Flavobacterium sp.]|uniref:hypothetical protein n=1 Tax=Flavobacterium sp. TaxID=239 RepID=UPI004047127C